MSNAGRLITLIMLLQRQPNQQAAELAQALGVSVRTLHRYITALDEMGIPIYSERGPYGGFSLVRGYKMPPLVFTPEEAVAVHLGTSLVGELWGQLYDEAARGALAKLDNVLPDEQRQEVAWARKALVATGMHRADLGALAPFLQELRRAIRERRRVALVYQGRNRPESDPRDLDPYALVHRGGWWYVVGHCHLRNAVRSFRVDRIQALNLLAQTFSPPDDFDVKAYLATEFQVMSQVPARLRFKPEGAHLAVYNQATWESLEHQTDGSVIVTLTAADLTWAAAWVLSYGGLAVVLEPEELRVMVHSWAQALVEEHTTMAND